MIGLTLILDGFGQEIPKGYVYFAMGFSIFVEMINLRVRDRHIKPVNLRDAYRGSKGGLQPVEVNEVVEKGTKVKVATKNTKPKPRGKKR
jgi:hypothetical protein